MRGYFGIGVERLTKPMNAGNLFRSAHAFGASFLFAVEGNYQRSHAVSDTGQSTFQVPFYEFANADDMLLPDGCRLVGIELLDDAVDLPTFKHPPQAAYVLGPERGSLSPEMIARCNHVVKIPTSFCINVAMAGAIVMYDRVISLGSFGRRSLSTLKHGEPPPVHIQGAQILRTNRADND
jgi:tRNA G18 (ribose-2'-O)-methylase SpoU